MGKRWTDKEDETLLLILKTQPLLSYVEIAKQIDRTPHSVHARIMRLRKRGQKIALRGSVLNELDKHRIRLLADVHTLTEIAEIVGVSVHAVRNYCHRNNIMVNKLRRMAIYNRVLQLRDKKAWEDVVSLINKEFKARYTPMSLGRQVNEVRKWVSP